MTNSIDRRMLMGTAGVAALVLPGWMQRAFAAECAPLMRDDVIDAGIARARAVGKPLLVIVVPAPGTQPNTRAYTWGRLLANASDEIMLDLAVCEVVCAGMRDVLALVPKRLATGARDPWAVLIETDAASLSATFVDGDVPAFEFHSKPDAPSGKLADVTALGALLRKAIAFDAATGQRRAKQSRATLKMDMTMKGNADTAAYEAITGDGGFGPIRLRDLDRFAALARWPDVEATGDRTALLAKLADAARARLFENDPPGAKWKAFSSYCPPCGMGRMSPESRYFLEFYTA